MLDSTTRIFCRNQHCRRKLKTPTDNPHAAFCCRGCHEIFYRTHCLVCGRDIRTDPMTGERRSRSSHRKFCGRKHKAEAAKFPHTYRYPAKLSASSKSVDKSRPKTGLRGDRPSLIGPADPPINILGGYRFPGAPGLARSDLAAIIAAESPYDPTLPRCPVERTLTWEEYLAIITDPDWGENETTTAATKPKNTAWVSP